MGLPQLINLRTTSIPDEGFYYIGRKSKRQGLDASFFANPYRVSRDLPRTQAIEKYRMYFYRTLIHEDGFDEEIRKVRMARFVGCHCSPKPCHWSIIREFISSRYGQYTEVVLEGEYVAGYANIANRTLLTVEHGVQDNMSIQPPALSLLEYEVVEEEGRFWCRLQVRPDVKVRVV